MTFTPPSGQYWKVRILTIHQGTLAAIEAIWFDEFDWKDETTGNTGCVESMIQLHVKHLEDRDSLKLGILFFHLRMLISFIVLTVINITILTSLKHQKYNKFFNLFVHYG